VGANAHGIEDESDLLQQMRQRQERDAAVLLLGQQVMSCLERADQVGVAEHHALRLTSRARSEDDLGQILGSGAPPAVDLPLPVARETCVWIRRQALHE